MELAVINRIEVFSSRYSSGRYIILSARVILRSVRGKETSTLTVSTFFFDQIRSQIL